MTKEEILEKEIISTDIEKAGKFLADIVVELTIARLRGNSIMIKRTVAKLALFSVIMEKKLTPHSTNLELLTSAYVDLTNTNNNF